MVTNDERERVLKGIGGILYDVLKEAGSVKTTIEDYERTVAVEIEKQQSVLTDLLAAAAHPEPNAGYNTIFQFFSMQLHNILGVKKEKFEKRDHELVVAATITDLRSHLTQIQPVFDKRQPVY